MEFNPHINKYSGNHVVSILGWGVAKGIKISNTQFAEFHIGFVEIHGEKIGEIKDILK